MIRIKWIFLFLAISIVSNGQDTIRIAVINDRFFENNVADDLRNRLENEIQQLLQHRYEIAFNYYSLIQDDQILPSQIDLAYTQNEIVICYGTVSSDLASKRTNFPKPTIAAFILDPELQGLTKTEDGSSGRDNFTYLESPFNLKRDIDLLYRISPYKHLVIASPPDALTNDAFIEALFSKFLAGKDVEIENVRYGSDIASWVADHDNEQHAVYVLPYFGSDPGYIPALFDLLNKEYQIPSVALLGEEYLEMGALAGYETEKNFRKIPRRLALSILRILEGANPSSLSVEMETFGENLLINMATARTIGIYPDFDLMGDAKLLNLVREEGVGQLSFQQAIAEALSNNLELKIEKTDIDISNTEIGIAKSDLWPQLDVTSSITRVDENTALTYQGTQGQTNWILSGGLSQVVLSEPLLANIAIQKLLKASEEQDLMQVQMDVIVDVASAYMNILFAKSNLDIQSQNVDRTKENYDISKTKEAIGYTGASDINRWTAELANANIELNNAYADLRQAKFLLNQLLNRPIDQAFDTEDISLEESMLIIADSRAEFIDNYGKLEKFADFLVEFSKTHLPSLEKINLGLKIEERLKKSRDRSLYLPSIGLQGSTNRILGKYNVPAGLPSFDNLTTWNLSLAANIPIFQGHRRTQQIQQSKLNILQLRDSRKNLENQLELRIRSNIEVVGASFSRMELSNTAAEASRKNYEIVRDAYSSGQTNIVTLIDAQNNALATQLNANIAVYTFVLDFLLLERSIGFFNFLSTPEERTDFFNQVQQYITNN